MKICSNQKCQIEKNESEFNKNKNTKDGLQHQCRACQKQYKKEHKQEKTEYQKQWRIEHKEELVEYEKQRYIKNKYKIDEKSKQHHIDNPEYAKQYYSENKKEILECHKQYRIENKEEVCKKSKEWRDQNPEYQREYRIKNPEYKKQYEREKLKTDLNYKLSHYLRARLNKAINGDYKSGSAINDLGCSIEELCIRLVSLFYNRYSTGEKMTWKNYGKEWHIDHIIPLSFFDLTDRGQLLIAVHYTNLQPLWKEDNLSKGNRLEWEFYE
jgi:hypothetical protein